MGVLLVANMAAQQAVLVPVPFLQPDGSIPPAYANRHVFLDPKSQNGVIIYPSNPDGSFSTEPGAPLRRHVVKLRRGVAPSISANAQRIGDGSYTYDYIVSNAGVARHPIAEWRFFERRLGSISHVNMPAGWIKSVAAGNQAVNPRDGVLPGGTSGQFTVSSGARPGYVRILTASAATDNSALPHDLPAHVLSDIERLQDTSFNSQSVMTIGPRFEANTPVKEIVAHFVDSIQKAIRVGKLQGQSQFTQEVL
ncbi:MAG: hypothetical protein ACRD7E_00310, partial [Bryobacteraceae bacterium]